MTKTATVSARKPAVAPATPAVDEFSDTKVSEDAEALLKQCSEVRVRINWFGTSAKVDEEMAIEMLKGTDAARGAVSIGKRLLSSKHEALSAVKEARQAIEAHVAAWTVPMLAIRASSSPDSSLRKDAGIRLIQKKDMAQFDERLGYLKGLLHTAAQSLQRKLPEIKEQDRERLGRLYDEGDYPTDVTALIGVEVTYKTAGVDLDWETLCPAIYERERDAARQKFTAVVENAAAEFAGRFVKYVKQVVDQLGNRIRINPVDSHGTAHVIGPDDELVNVNIRDAEVLDKLTHSTDEEVPAGSVLLKVRLAKGGKKGRAFEAWFAKPITENEYATKLRPYASTDRKKLYDSTIDNLKQEMEAFLNIGELLGPYREVIAGSVERVKNMLGKGDSGLDTSRIAEQLRQGDYFRNEMKTVLEGVAHVVESGMADAQQVRRKIRKGLIGKV